MSNELGLHKPSLNFMRAGKNFEGIKKVVSGRSDNGVKGGGDALAEDYIKFSGRKSPLNKMEFHTESTKEAVKYTLDTNKTSINKIFKDLDKVNCGVLAESEMLKVLKLFGIFVQKKVSF